MPDTGADSRGTSGKSPAVRATPPVAALLFAPASVIAYMAFNLNQTSFADAGPAIAAATAFAALVWAVTVAVRRRADAVSAAIAAVWVVWTLQYVSLFTALNARLGGGYSMAGTLPVALAGLALVTFALVRLGRACAPIHIVMSAIAATMLATPLWRAADYAWRHGGEAKVYDAEAAAREIARFVPASPGPDGTRPPDIFHFVFDRFASARILERHYGVQTAAPDFLERRGFYVAPDSRSNYIKTGHSLASTFYMDYLDLFAGEARPDGSNWHPIFAMLDDHRVGRVLRGRGYEIAQFGGWWTGTHDSSVADVNRPYGFDEFAMYYLRRTALRTLVGVAPGLALSQRLDWDNAQCHRLSRQIEEIKAIAGGERPLYVFAHFLLPHDPYVFATDGRCVTVEDSAARGKPQGYLDQLVYADRVIAELVEALQERDVPPVILITADEGPFPERDYSIPWQDASVEELSIKTGILNAFYFPDGDYGALTPDVSPVNTYRIVFDKYLGTTFPRLEDRTYAFPTDSELYDFFDVTERLRDAEAPAAPDPID